MNIDWTAITLQQQKKNNDDVCFQGNQDYTVT